ncbi:hypothetical protein QWY97_04865 [Vibrio cortegadensis]|uniref:hypothetical protein n=1 Tax=Vibrio cortegadensis TaxID=1328770 RepID=UPI0021C3405B|nr:hypothetical protein [Vibrio cortegadensis]MDN3696680.1 hypothetical protein [Vibrio cortegadensis]
MSKLQRLITTFLNNLKPNPTTIAKSTDYEVNLSTMKDSGLLTGVRCLVRLPVPYLNDKASTKVGA